MVESDFPVGDRGEEVCGPGRSKANGYYKMSLFLTIVSLIIASYYLYILHNITSQLFPDMEYDLSLLVTYLPQLVFIFSPTMFFILAALASKKSKSGVGKEIIIGISFSLGIVMNCFVVISAFITITMAMFGDAPSGTSSMENYQSELDKAPAKVVPHFPQPIPDYAMDPQLFAVHEGLEEKHYLQLSFILPLERKRALEEECAGKSIQILDGLGRIVGGSQLDQRLPMPGNMEDQPTAYDNAEGNIYLLREDARIYILMHKGELTEEEREARYGDSTALIENLTSPSLPGDNNFPPQYPFYTAGITFQEDSTRVIYWSIYFGYYP